MHSVGKFSHPSSGAWFVRLAESVVMKVTAPNEDRMAEEGSICNGSITAAKQSVPTSTLIYRPSGGRPLVNLSNAGRSFPTVRNWFVNSPRARKLYDSKGAE